MYLFSYESRKNLIKTRIRKFLKIINKNIKLFDKIVFEHCKTSLYEEFHSNKGKFDMKNTYKKFNKINNVIEDLEYINQNLGRLKDDIAFKEEFDKRFISFDVNFLNLDYLLKESYGQIGKKKVLFCISHSLYLNDRNKLLFRRKIKYDFFQTDLGISLLKNEI